MTVTAENTTMPTTHAHDQTSGVSGSTMGTRAAPTTTICTRERSDGHEDRTSEAQVLLRR